MRHYALSCGIKQTLRDRSAVVASDWCHGVGDGCRGGLGVVVGVPGWFDGGMAKSVDQKRNGGSDGGGGDTLVRSAGGRRRSL